MTTAVSRFLLGVLCAAAAAAASVACNVPEPPGSTGGIRGLSPSPDADCGRGFVVLESSYQSTNIALLDINGRVLTDSLVSSAAAATGVAPPLSGDIVLTTERASGWRLPLVDRAYGSPQITWVDLENGGIADVLPVDTGFPSNPQDYVTLGPHKAYVSRFGDNRAAGEQAFDQGNDLLLVEPSAKQILGSIDLRPALGAEAAENLPRPGRMLLREQRLLVLLATLPRQGFDATTSSRLAIVDTESDTLQGALLLEGLHDCTGLALAPSGDQLAVFCSALRGQRGDSELEASGIAIVDLRAEPRLERVISGPLFDSRPVGAAGAYVTDSVLLLTTFGAFDELNHPLAQDNLLRLDLNDDSVEVLLSSDGTPFTLGGIACEPACGVCMVADAGRSGGIVHGYAFDADGWPRSETAIKVETRIGLPPRSIGHF